AENSERAIDVQITRLRRKIEPDPKEPRFLQTVRGTGYMLVCD
ncbi:MAG TPA: winged helix family transcriptional regulator, partial [Paracoccus sp.]|nr:winged helix family transcriptional regulator [Paracoccus sp. (in: a-proteobacteria)]